MEMDRIAVKRELLKGLKGYASKGVAEGLKKEYCTCEEEAQDPGMDVEGVSNGENPELDEEKLLAMLKGGVE